MNRRLSLGAAAALMLLPARLPAAGAAPAPDKPCPGYSLEPREPSFEAYRPSSATIDGVAFPRDGEESRRGGPRRSRNWSLVLALRAMLGDPSAFVGSKFFSLAQDTLKERGRGSARAWPAAFWLHHVLEDAKSLDACAPFSDAEAAVYAADLTRKAFLRQDSAVPLDETLLDETSPGFDWYPDIAIYSTVYPDIAPMYGGKELSFRAAGRSIDRHYWMAARGRAGLDQVKLDLPFREAADWRINDAGSLVTPGYIRPEEITGYYLRGKETRDLDAWRSPAPRQWGLRLVFRKVRAEGTDFVVILDGQDRECVAQGRDGRFRFCRFGPLGPDSKLVRPAPVLDRAGEVPVVAALAACAPGKRCALPRALRRLLRVPSKLSLDADLLNFIKAARVPGKTVALFAPDGTPLDFSSANDCPPGAVWRHASRGDRRCVAPETAEAVWLAD
jgi:hypothetical protein